MKISLIVVGKTNKKYVADGIDIFKKRINKYLSFDIIEIQDIKNAKNKSAIQIKQEERDKILKVVKTDDYIILLDEKGQTYDSVSFSNKLESLMIQSKRRVLFIIGGAYGFDSFLYQKADETISLSKMTFSHQLIRLIFTEQLYRAYTIINNEPYHNV